MMMMIIIMAARDVPCVRGSVNIRNSRGPRGTWPREREFERSWGKKSRSMPVTRSVHVRLHHDCLPHCRTVENHTSFFSSLSPLSKSFSSLLDIILLCILSLEILCALLSFNFHLICHCRPANGLTFHFSKTSGTLVSFFTQRKTVLKFKNFSSPLRHLI